MSGRDAMGVLLHAMARLEQLCGACPEGWISTRLVREILDEASKAYDEAEHASHIAARVTP